MESVELTTEQQLTKIFVRGKTEVEGIWGPPSKLKIDEVATIRKDDLFASGPVDCMEFSPDGQFVCLVDREVGFTVVNTETSEVMLIKEHPGIQAVSWSSMGSFLLSWQRSKKDAPEAGLIVWNALNGIIVSRYHQKTFSKEIWPSVQWSSDESICARMVSNEVHIYNGKDMEAGVISKIIAPGVASFSVAPGEPPFKIAAFIPEKKGRPASVKIYHYPNTETVRASKSFYKAQEVDMKWSSNGNALIIQSRTDVDSSGKSYYGETGLFFIHSDGNFDCIVPLTREGQVHDVQWDPTGRGFIVLAGPMPCNATLYDYQARPIFEFGQAHRNVISWSPHGRFVCIAGFGNLRGDMDFWDRNKLKKMGSCNANSTTSFGWSPDSRYFLTATTFPRLRVDNGFKIFKYNGIGPLLEESRTELYDVKWRPALPDAYPNRPQSPKRKGEESAAQQAVVAAPEPPKAYRPPRSTGNSNFAEMLRRENTGSRKLDANKYVPPGSIPGAAPSIPGLVPGMPIPTKIKSRNARKKKNKDKLETEKAITQATLEAKKEASTTTPVSIIVTISELSAEEKQKKIKNLTKKLQQIESLKAKVAAGESINEDQTSKLNSETSIREEIARYST